MSDQFFVGLDLTALEDNKPMRPVSRVTLLLDDDNAITSGDDTGIEITADCPHATQAMVDAILSNLKGYQYHAFTASDTNIDPSAELGDGVTVGGIYGVIAKIDDDGSGYPSIEAPGEAELEEEYPSAGPMTQAFNRKIAETRSSITKTAKEIRLEIQNEVSGLSSSIDVKLEGITARVDGLDGAYSDISVQVGSITTRVNGLDSAYSALDQYVDSITLSVSNGETSSTIKLMAGSAEISSQNITFSGFVTFTGLSGGTTTIDGACIKTGTIAAEHLELTGAISWGDLSDNVQEQINSIGQKAQDAKTVADDVDSLVGGWTYRGSTYIDGSMLMTGTVMASQLLGGTVGLLDDRERQVGGIDITETNNRGVGLEFWTEYGGIRMLAGGNIYLASWDGDGPLIQIGTDDVQIGGYANLIPQSGTGSQSLGNYGFPWGDIYTLNSVTTLADKSIKTNISYDLSTYDALFDNLKPASFQYTGEYSQSGRTHLGLISQDVETAIADAGLSSMDFAGFVKSPVDGENPIYSLREEEFLSMCIWRVQQLTKRVAEIEKRLGAAM